MLSIEVIPDNDGCGVILLKDCIEEKSETGWYKTPVEVAMKVRQLTEDYMGIGE